MSGDVLFLAHRVPYPPDRGDKMRSFHLLRHLAGMTRVHLAAFADNDADLEHAEALRPMVGRLHVERRSRSAVAALPGALLRGRPVSLAAFESASMHAAVQNMLADLPIATVFAFSGQMAQFVPAGDFRFVMDFVDVDSAKFAAYADAGHGPMRWLHAREARLLGRYEQAVASRADVSLFVSDVEAELFRRNSGLPAESVTTLENGVDFERYALAASIPPLSAAERGPGPLIVFTGQMDYSPNVDAALGFAASVLPEIQARHGSARFAIVGRKPGAALRRLDGRGGVVVTGEVADVRSWLAAADIVVAPLAIARGIQNKVLEGMAMERPVVASPAAFEGIDAEPGRDLIVCEADVMAPEILRLLSDRGRARAIAIAGRRRIERRYGWETQLRPLTDILGRAGRLPVDAAA